MGAVANVEIITMRIAVHVLLVRSFIAGMFDLSTPVELLLFQWNLVGSFVHVHLCRSYLSNAFNRCQL